MCEQLKELCSLQTHRIFLKGAVKQMSICIQAALKSQAKSSGFWEKVIFDQQLLIVSTYQPYFFLPSILPFPGYAHFENSASWHSTDASRLTMGLYPDKPIHIENILSQNYI